MSEPGVLYYIKDVKKILGILSSAIKQLQPFGQGRRQEAEGSYVDVTVYTRMECLLPCLAHQPIMHES